MNSYGGRILRVNLTDGTIQEELIRLRKERAALNADLIRTSEKVQNTEAKMTSIEDRLGIFEGKEKKLRASLNSQHRSIGRLLAAIQRAMRALAGPVGVAVVNEAALEHRFDQVAQRVVHYPIAERRG